MSGNTSSAEPQTLLEYCRVLAPLDQRVVLASASLAGDLASFESSCTEYSVSVGYLADSMGSHGRSAGGIDEWVKTVGDRFLWADGGMGESLLAHAPPPDEADDWGINALDWLATLLDLGSTLSNVLLWKFFIHVGKKGQLYTRIPGLLTRFPWMGSLVRNMRWLGGHGLSGAVATNLDKWGVPLAAGWVVSGIFTGLDVWHDVQDYQTGLRDKSQLASAIFVDTVVGLAPIAVTTALVALGVITPVGWAALGIAAVGVGVKWWMDKDGGKNREWVIGGVDRAANAIGGAATRGAAWIDDNVLQPVGGSIREAGERAQGWIDGAADAFRNRRVPAGLTV